MAELICPVCDTGFEPRADGGKAQQFCSSRCRRVGDHAGRLWIRRALQAGRLTWGEVLECLPSNARVGYRGNRPLLATQEPEAAPQQCDVAAGGLPSLPP
jgi:hypothetical protein